MKTYICVECGQPYEWERAKRNKCCEACSVKHMIQSVRQLQAKEGPYYEKWRERTERARRELEVMKE